MIIQILEDKRTVVAVGCGESFWKLGADSVTCIESYGELGEYCLIPWCAVFYNNEGEPTIRVKPDFIRYEGT